MAGGSQSPRFPQQPGSMAHSKTYNSVTLLLMSQNGAVLQSNYPGLSFLPIWRVVHKNLQNLNTVQYVLDQVGGTL